MLSSLHSKDQSISFLIRFHRNSLVCHYHPIIIQSNVRRDSLSSTVSYFPKGVRITVQDTGIGISSDNQKKLFHAFEKLELGYQPLTVNPTGAGLGLVISNNLVQRLSPNALSQTECKMIKFVSEENIGSTFYFEVYNCNDKPGGLIEAFKLNSNEIMSIGSDTGLELLCLNELRREISPRKHDTETEMINLLQKPHKFSEFEES